MALSVSLVLFLALLSFGQAISSRIIKETSLIRARSDVRVLKDSAEIDLDQDSDSEEYIFIRYILNIFKYIIYLFIIGLSIYLYFIYSWLLHLEYI